jgi:hypothetical protein
MQNHLLSRRNFLNQGVSGLGSIALASLLAQKGLLANDPIRPRIDPAHPYAPRPPHFEPRAKNVLVIFCSGAMSHVDTFDYKAARHAAARRGGFDHLPGGAGESGEAAPGVQASWTERKDDQ